jgi:hypothetical protein
MAAKGESKAGLVTFLVIFILLSLTLGVTTYYGYDAADREHKAAEDAKKEKDQWNNDANYYKFLALSYRAYLGQPATKDDLAGMRSQYDSGALKTRDQNEADHKKTLTETFGPNSPYKWDVTLKKPSQNFQDQIDLLKKELADKDKAVKDATEQARKANELAESTKRELAQAQTDYASKLAEQQKKDEAERGALLAKVATLQKELDAKGEVALKELEPLKKDVNQLRVDNKRLTGELGQAVKTIQDRGIETAKEQSAAAFDVSKIAPENLRKIVSITGAGDMPYINVGTADNLKRQVTFSIFGRGNDGRALREPKGKLEVVRVTGEHLAQARITDLKDERRDPVMVGDFIYNPAWNPNLKEHVAIIGKVDLTGDGGDDLQEFIRNLKNMNVEVDSWMDMKTRKITGEISRQTDMLIVGDYPDFGTGVIKADDANAAAKNESMKIMNEELAKAEKFGVRIVKLNTFLDMSGYTLPKPLGQAKDKIQFQRNLPSTNSPDRRGAPPQK